MVPTVPDAPDPQAPMLDPVAPPVTPESIALAHRRIAHYVRRTPLEPSPALSARLGVETWLKLENWQVTGSFKPRIAFAKLLDMTAEERSRGVIASTAGGHGIGLSHAAERLGIPVRIFLPRSADPRKVAVMLRQGAELTRFDSVEEARTAAIREAVRSGATFVSAYNDPVIISGGGTVGKEIVEDLPGVATLVTGIGGGGLITGSAIAIRARQPRLEVVGVQPAGSAVLARWLDAGHPVEVAVAPSIADGLGAAIEHDSITFPLARREVQRVLTVDDGAIREAMRWALAEHQMVLEPSGAAPIAALLDGGAPPAGPVVVIVTGRNISRERYLDLIASG